MMMGDFNKMNGYLLGSHIFIFSSIKKLVELKWISLFIIVGPDYKCNAMQYKY